MVGIIGHRGAKDIWPENSLDGFRKVLALPVAGVEFDLHPTADGGLAVIHDALLDRTTEAQGPVAARSMAELGAVRLTGTREGVPSLDAVLDILAPSGLDLHVELKADAEGQPYPGMEARVADHLRGRGLVDRAVLTSFWLPVLARLREAWPDGRLLASLNAASVQKQGGLEAVLTGLEASRVDYVAVHHELLAQDMDLFQRRVGAARLCAWVINSPEQIARWRDAPVGFITTDRPDLFF